MNLSYVQHWGAFRSLASLPKLSPEAKKRLQWMDYYRKCGNAAQTCRYFGISRETFYEWKRRYNPHHLESDARFEKKLDTKREAVYFIKD